MKISWIIIMVSMCVAASRAISTTHTPPPMNFNPRPPYSHSYFLDGYLKSGEKISFSSYFYKRDGGSQFVCFDDSIIGNKDSLKIRFVDDFDSLVVKIYDVQKNDTNRIKAIKHEGEWIYKAINGRISVYSLSPEKFDYAYMKFDSNSIEKYDKKIVKEKLLKNPNSKKELRWKTYDNLLTTGMILTGAFLTFAGMVETTKEDTNNDGRIETRPGPLSFIGIGTLTISFVPFFAGLDNFESAILEYNR